MRAALIALSQQWGSYALLIGAVVLVARWFGNRYVDRRSEAEWQDLVRSVEHDRTPQRAEWAKRQRARRNARAKLERFHGGDDAA